MSINVEIITILPPSRLVPGQNVEIFQGKAVECAYCQGKGFFESGLATRNDPAQDPCPVCHGSGQLQAKVTIEWNGVP